ncbi:efflux RND transporter permease subunit [Devosia sp. MC1541]|uniref:efflux RND transporter permease subunit n=1 Tax=Devosia sp. MC1541 TaxID=2725264 RepID=UPI00145D02AE
MSQPSIFKRALDRVTHKRSIGFGLEHIGLTTLRHPKIVALLVVLLSIATFSQLPKANVDGDLLRVFAHSGDHYDAYEDLSRTFGTFENDIYVMVTADRLVEPEVLEEIRSLAFELELNEFVTGTMSPFTMRTPTWDGSSVPAVPEDMLTPDEVAMTLMDLQQFDPMMRNLITPDLDGVVLIVFTDKDMVSEHGAPAMIASLRESLALYESADIQTEVTGPPIWTGEMVNASVSDQIKFTIWGFALGAVIAFATLRSFWGALLVAATPFVAVSWTMGAALYFFGSFTFLTIIVTTLVLVISFAEAMFFIFNWLGYWRDGMEPNEAVDATVKLVGPAAALTMLTTFVSFASLSLTPGQGIREFSIAGAMGTFLLFVCLMTFLPLLLKLAIKLGFTPPKRYSRALTAPLPLSWKLANKFGRPISVAAIVVTLLLLIPYALIKPHFSFEDFMAKDSMALATAESIDEGVGGVAPLYVRIGLADPGDGLSDRDFTKIQTVHAITEKHVGENKVISAASVTEYAAAGLTHDELFESVGPFMQRRFINEEGSQALVTGFIPTIIQSDALQDMVDAMQADFRAAGIDDATVGGFRVLATLATDDIVRGLQLDLTLSVLINLALIGFAFQSFRVALASAIPNLFPILATEAWLYFSGAGLQLTTVIALTIAFGIAVDDTVHFLSHYLHARRAKGLEHKEAVKHTIDRIGGAIIATTIILCAGVFIVVFSDLPQVALFGTLFVGTLAFALIGDLFILPALLVAGGKFFQPLGKISVQLGEEAGSNMDAHAPDLKSATNPKP